MKSFSKSSPKRVEAAIQRALVAWIKETYPEIRCVATLNENNRHCMDMGCEVGITDLLLIHTRNDVARIFYLELKTKTGRLSQSEKNWYADNYKPASNTHYAVAYGFTNARNEVTFWMGD